MRAKLSILLFVCYVVISSFDSGFAESDIKVSETLFSYDNEFVASDQTVVKPIVEELLIDDPTEDHKFITDDSKDLDVAAGHHSSHKHEHSSHGGGGGHGGHSAGHGKWGNH